VWYTKTSVYGHNMQQFRCKKHVGLSLPKESKMKSSANLLKVQRAVQYSEAKRPGSIFSRICYKENNINRSFYPELHRKCRKLCCKTHLPTSSYCCTYIKISAIRWYFLLLTEISMERQKNNN
jgi:hypothetical protein